MSDPVVRTEADMRTSAEYNPPVHEKPVTFEDTKDASRDIDLEASASGVSAEAASEEVIVARELRQRSGILRKLREGEEWLDAKLGIETQGVDRIHEDDKKPPSKINV
jgi:hypothetical protein